MNSKKGMAILELEELLEQGCDNPKCPCGNSKERMFLAAGCHPKAGTDVQYAKGTGVLTVSCHQCHRLVAEVCVALIAT